MSRMSDRSYLLTEQYKDASNLTARITVHERFSTNPYGLFRWIFDHFQLPAEAKVLELGCGPGQLWLKNIDRLPVGWEIMLSDFSPGMLEEARRNLSGSSHPFTFQVIDAQRIPFEDESFDAVITNHMLYHVPDRPAALAEIRRVLRPGGHLYAATLGRGHLEELQTLRRTLDPEAGPFGGRLVEAFGLENGAEQIAPWLPDVTLYRYEDSLAVTDVEPLVDYVRSSTFYRAFSDEQLAQFRAFVGNEIERHGVFHISKDSGLFVARRDA